MRKIGILLFLIVIHVDIVFANYYGNIARPVENGKFDLGIGTTDLTRKVKWTGNIDCNAYCYDETGSGTDDMKYSEILFSMGVGFAGHEGVEIRAGQFTGKPENGENRVGPEYGLLYRHTIGSDTDTLRKGIAISFLAAQYESSEAKGSHRQIDVAVGAAKPIEENVSLYGLILYSKFNGQLSAKEDLLSEIEYYYDLPQGSISSFTYDIENDTPIGFVFGGEFDIGDAIFLGVELHGMFESGFAAFLRLGL